MMSRIEYRTPDINEIDIIRPLWIKLNDFMLGEAGTFRTHYEQMTFEERKAYFNKVTVAGTLHLDRAFNFQVRGKYVGYCVSASGGSCIFYSCFILFNSCFNNFLYE